MRRGEIRWLNCPPPGKRRPILIITRDSALPKLNEIVVVPVTTTVRHIPTEVVFGPEVGVPETCAANLDHIQTVARQWLGDRITMIGEHRMQEIKAAMLFATGFSNDR